MTDDIILKVYAPRTVDYHAVPERQEPMHRRLLNWAVYCHGGPSSSVNPMFRLYKPERDATYNPPEPRIECDFADGMRVNQMVVNLPERHRLGIQWFYIVKDSPNKARKRVDATHEGLAKLVIEARDMMSFRGA